MSTIIKFDLKELRKLANDKDSCVVEKRVTQNLALQPWCLGNLKESIKNLLDYKIGKFDKDFKGILLSFKNLQILQNVGSIRNDNADVHFQVQADYFIFRPRVGATLRGVVNKKSSTHLSILVHRVFNVVIPRPTEEPGNKWIGVTIHEGQEVMFRIVVLDLFGALPYIRGELDEKSLKRAADGDEEFVLSRQVEPIPVSYVDFDKTKPRIQSQMGDGKRQTSPDTTKINAKLINKDIPHHTQTRNTRTPNMDKPPATKTKNSGSEASIAGYKKNKRQTMDIDAVTVESPARLLKKHRKES